MKRWSEIHETKWMVGTHAAFLPRIYIRPYCTKITYALLAQIIHTPVLRKNYIRPSCTKIYIRPSCAKSTYTLLALKLQRLRLYVPRFLFCLSWTSIFFNFYIRPSCTKESMSYIRPSCTKTSMSHIRPSCTKTTNCFVQEYNNNILANLITWHIRIWNSVNRPSGWTRR